LSDIGGISSDRYERFSLNHPVFRREWQIVVNNSTKSGLISTSMLSIFMPRALSAGL
jgi:hypothetical protein